MELNKIQTLIYKVTRELVEQEMIFDRESRRKYIQCFIKPTEAPVLPMQDMEINKIEHDKTEQERSKFPEGVQIHFPAWLTKLKAKQQINNIMVTSLKCVASRDLQTYEAVLALEGDLLGCTSGYELYKCYGDSYSGTIIFNLGQEFDFLWFCTKNYITEPQSKMMLTSTDSNSDIVVIKLNNTIHPIVYATKPIEMGQYIFLSNSWIKERNLQFCAWIKNAGVVDPEN